jgi:predicted adenine nucleotide alpha hydrolase (AANH) superfamily ATPase
MPKVLIHCCCAHCAAYPVQHWREQGYEVSALWYNPNIHPYLEHRRRLEAMQSLAADLELPLEIIPGYDMPEYFQRVAGREDERCRYCYELRLAATAAAARTGGFDCFTSTLLISHHQPHELIQEVGERLAGESGGTFLYADLRKRYSDSRRITKPMELYRQQYCGCVYSEFERYGESRQL